MHKRISPHGDYDHIGEAINLVNNFKVEKVIFNCMIFILHTEYYNIVKYNTLYNVYIDWNSKMSSFLYNICYNQIRRV